MTMTMFMTKTMTMIAILYWHQRTVANDTDISSKLEIADVFNNYIRCEKHTLTTITSNTSPSLYINAAEPALYLAKVSNNDVISVMLYT